ncbi:MAG: invasion associated locus B family protein [Holosporales bacterium]|jgi:hypothetical protein
MRYVLVFCLSVVCLGFSAYAQDPTPILNNGAWEGYQIPEGDVKTCYMVATPGRQEGVVGPRGSVYLFITHKPIQKQFDVVSIDAGYPYEKNSKATLQIGAKTFTLSTNGPIAWSEDIRIDREMVEALKNSSEAILKGTSSRQQKTRDIFYLSGFSVVHKAITEACR